MNKSLSVMPVRKRDSSFLYMAAVAGIGGLLALIVAIGIPLWSLAHHQPFNPSFSFFAGWGVAALGGCYGCLHTYFLTDTPAPRPPRGGLHLVPYEAHQLRALPNPIVADGESRAA